MAIDDKIKALTKQLYPTGRVWRINPNSIKEKFVNGLLASEIRAYNDGVSILDSAIPDNPNFTVDDASAWEKRLGLPDGTGIDLADRIKAIIVQLNWPGTNPAKGAIDYLQSVLQAAGFNTCAQENLFQGPSSFVLVSNSNFNGVFQDVTYGNGKFVAGGQLSGTGCIVYSSDGVTWSSPVTITAGGVGSITFGNGIFVALASGQAWVSSDAITWTPHSLPNSNGIAEHAINYGNGLFVIVHNSGTGNRVTTSSDGITWTPRTSAADLPWTSVVYANGQFVAVATTTSVMTSPDGITWSLQSCPSGSWYDITYAAGLFVAVAFNGTNRVMTSTDGITWTARTPSSAAQWYSVAFGDTDFFAVSFDGLIMSSPDGITWTSVSSPAAYAWKTITFGNSTFVAVAFTANTQNIMYALPGAYFHKTLADFAGTNFTQYKTALQYGQQNYGKQRIKGVIIANSVDPNGDANFDIGDGSDTIFIGGCPPGTYINIPKSQETAFRQLIIKIKPVNVTVLLLVNFV